MSPATLGRILADHRRGDLAPVVEHVIHLDQVRRALVLGVLPTTPPARTGAHHPTSHSSPGSRRATSGARAPHRTLPGTATGAATRRTARAPRAESGLTTRGTTRPQPPAGAPDPAATRTAGTAAA